MSIAIRNALIAVPALVTLILGFTFIILVFVLVIRTISVMPLLRRALKIYVAKNSSYVPPDHSPLRPSLWKRIISSISNIGVGADGNKSEKGRDKPWQK